ncbi:MAG: hypothetical protein BWY96_01104 [Spirochaetes bacterium ADurb.BinA120]|nr:MAG: hypothetical protein BWY96_01104 [Spirochaetes bacterium ADurb.BinA120]OQB81369.1 MAG: hypothetical protein BWX88_04306 [Planctomycetes bacterium ADurb.Bin126]
MIDPAPPASTIEAELTVPADDSRFSELPAALAPVRFTSALNAPRVVSNEPMYSAWIDPPVHEPA